VGQASPIWKRSCNGSISGRSVGFPIE
jgi:hypothetical protein